MYPGQWSSCCLTLFWSCCCMLFTRN
jgi:hypothetical protein